VEKIPAREPFEGMINAEPGRYGRKLRISKARRKKELGRAHAGPLYRLLLLMLCYYQVGLMLMERNRSTAPRQAVKRSVPEGYRIYAIGDVHGRADLLDALLRRIDADLARRPITQSTQVFLGDYIDRGPHSRQVIDLLIARRREHRALFLMGNHELCALQALSERSILSGWMEMGGASTLISYGVTPSRRPDTRADREDAIAFGEAMPESHRKFIESLALAFTCGDFFFTHAGVRPGIPLGRQHQQDLLWIREDFLLHEDDFGKVVVHGHTPTMQPDIRPNRINIDTGAYATGRLTCLVLEGSEVSFL
jgi:serine/threonine protein phosphatase 1